MGETPDSNVLQLVDAEVLPGLEEIIERLKHLREQGHNINKDIENSVEFKNPYLLEKVMKIFDIDWYSTNFKKSVYDPGYYVMLANEAEIEPKKPKHIANKAEPERGQDAPPSSRNRRNRSGWSPGP